MWPLEGNRLATRKSLSRPRPELSKNAQCVRRFRERLQRRLTGRYAMHAAAELYKLMRDPETERRDRILAARALLQAGQRALETAEQVHQPMLEMLQRVIDAEVSISPANAPVLAEAGASHSHGNGEESASMGSSVAPHLACSAPS